MNQATLESKERSLRGIERKVYDAVPVESYATIHQITGEILRMTGSSPDKRTVSHCLCAMADDGLLRCQDDKYRRAHRPKIPVLMPVGALQPPKEPEPEPPKQPEPEPPKQPDDPLAMISVVISDALELAKRTKEMVATLEHLAIHLQEKFERMEKSAAAAKRFKEFLKEMGDE